MKLYADMDLHDAHIVERLMYFGNNPERCPNYWAHTRSPDGYLSWHEWAEEKQKTHKQRQCDGCGLYAIWTPPASVAAVTPRLRDAS